MSPLVLRNGSCVEDVPPGAAIDEIFIRSHGGVDYLEFFRNGHVVGHGGSPRGGTPYRIKLNPGQCITRIYQYGFGTRFIDAIRFEANDGQVWTQGTVSDSGQEFAAEKGECLVGVEVMTAYGTRWGRMVYKMLPVFRVPKP
jgi:hypothetical protein